MKKRINCILLLITIVCFVIAIRLSSMPVFTFLPDYIKSIFITSSSIKEQYSFVYDVSMGIILSALFYFIVDVIPEKIKIHKAKKILSFQINRLLEYMEQIISLIVSVYERNSKLNELADKDFLILNGETQLPNREISYLTTTYYKNGKKKTAVHSYGTLNCIVKNNISKIMDCLEQIKKFEYFYSDHTELIEYIRMLECNDVLNWYKKKDKNDTNCFLLYGTNKKVAEFISLYVRIKKLKFNSEYTVTTLDTKSETDKYKQERDDGTLLKYVFDCQQKRQNLANSNPTLVIGSQKYTTKILTEQLSKNFEATYTINEHVDFDGISNYKFVVVIVDSISKKTLTCLKSSIKTPTNIILLTEKRLFIRKYTRFLKSENITIIDELYFKSDWKLFAFSIRKEEPSEKNISDTTSKLRQLCFNEKE